MSAAPDIPSDGLSGKLVRFYWPAVVFVTVAVVFSQALIGLLADPTPGADDYIRLIGLGSLLLLAAGIAYALTRKATKPAPGWLMWAAFLVSIGALAIDGIVRDGLVDWFRSVWPWIAVYAAIFLLGEVLRPLVRWLASSQPKYERVRPLDLSRD